MTVAKRNADGTGFEATPYEIVDEQELWNDWVVVRTRFAHNIDTEATGADYQEAVQRALNELGVAIKTTNPPVLNVEDTEINLHSASAVSGAKGSTVGDILLELESDDADGKKAKEHRRTPDVLNLDAFLNLSCEAKEDESKKQMADLNMLSFYVYLISFADDEASTSTEIQFHSLALIRRSTALKDLYGLVIESVQRNIRLVLAGATNVRRNLNTFVFYPYEIGHFLSHVYPAKAEDDGM